jgi:hypothetical protein
MRGDAPKRRRSVVGAIAGSLICTVTGGCGLVSGLHGYSACGDDCADAAFVPQPELDVSPGSPDVAEATDTGGEESTSEDASEVGPVDTGAPGRDAAPIDGGDASPPLPQDASPEASRPDAGGCACEASTCCSSGACQTAHSNGVGQTFYDCEAQGTFTQTLAMEACVAFTGTNTQCVAAPVGVCGSSRAICSNGASTCWCWTYAGTGAGTVEKQFGLCPSACPSANGTMWN